MLITISCRRAGAILTHAPSNSFFLLSVTIKHGGIGLCEGTEWLTDTDIRRSGQTSPWRRAALYSLTAAHSKVSDS